MRMWNAPRAISGLEEDSGVMPLSFFLSHPRLGCPPQLSFRPAGLFAMVIPAGDE